MDLHAKDSDSRVEKILSATLGNYDKPLPKPQSRVEEYLLAIKEQGGGGGGGTTDYNALDNKPSINGTTLQGDLTLEDIGAASNGSKNTYNADGENVTIGGSGGNTYDPDSESVVIGGL
jgi:hypothetical protein